MNVFKYNRTITQCAIVANKLINQNIPDLTIVSTDELIGNYLLITSNTQHFYEDYALKKVDQLKNKPHTIITDPNQSYFIPEPLSNAVNPEIPEGAVKPIVNVYVNFYITPSTARNAEILATFYKNVENDLIDKIYVIRTASDCHNIKSDKIVDIITDERPKYTTWFMYINEYTHDDDINVIINSDCFFNSNFKYLVYHMKHT